MKKIFVSIGVLILIIQLYLFLRADFIYGIDAPGIKDQILAILVLEAVAFSSLGMSIPTLGTNIFDIWKFSLVFIITAIIFSFIPTSTVQGLLGSAAVNTIGYGLLHAFVIAYGEEIVFRGLFPRFIGDIPSAVLFGVFHWGISGYSIGSIVVLILGLAIPAMIIRKRIGLLGSVGYHFAWNMKALGLLDVMLKSLGVG